MIDSGTKPHTSLLGLGHKLTRKETRVPYIAHRPVT